MAAGGVAGGEAGVANSGECYWICTDWHSDSFTLVKYNIFYEMVLPMDKLRKQVEVLEKQVVGLQRRLDRLERVDRGALERQTIRDSNEYKRKNESRHPRQDSPADKK